MIYAVKISDNEYKFIDQEASFTTHFLKLKYDELKAFSENGVAHAPGTIIPYNLYHSAHAIDCWEDDDFERFQCVKINEPQVPDGMVVKKYTLTNTNGTLGVIGTYEQAPVPEQVDRHQILLQLHDDNKLDDVEYFVASQDCPKGVKLYYENAQKFEREHSKTVELFDKLGWTVDEVDGLFRRASQQS